MKEQAQAQGRRGNGKAPPEHTGRWVETLGARLVEREHAPQRLLRIEGRTDPACDTAAVEFWLSDQARTAMTLASGERLDESWEDIEAECALDDDENENREWIAIHVPTPASIGTDTLKQAAQLLGALAAMNRDDGGTIRARARNHEAGHMLRGRITRPERPGGEWAPERLGEQVVCEAGSNTLNEMLNAARESGWDADRERVERMLAHMEVEIRERLARIGWALASPVVAAHNGYSVEATDRIAWCARRRRGMELPFTPEMYRILECSDPELIDGWRQAAH